MKLQIKEEQLDYIKTLSSRKKKRKFLLKVFLENLLIEETVNKPKKRVPLEDMYKQHPMEGILIDKNELDAIWVTEEEIDGMLIRKEMYALRDSLKLKSLLLIINEIKQLTGSSIADLQEVIDKLK
jgi:hypothetical protein